MTSRDRELITIDEGLGRIYSTLFISLDLNNQTILYNILLVRGTIGPACWYWHCAIGWQ